MIDAGIIGEDERIELLEGELVVMSPKGRVHEVLRFALAEAMSDARPKDMRVASEPTLQFADNVIAEPDIAVFPRASIPESSAGFVRLPSGSVMLVVEIAVTSLRGDKTRKAALYARQGVREFWVVDASERKAWIYTGPSADGWSSIVEHGPDDVLTTPALPDLSVRLRDLE
ncbi:MAG: Uma2 family endonuclease [Alphaproteobacteria bacterium]|nr:Uma2 family endonuclease [Alphaproteobacteria bacterium]